MRQSLTLQRNTEVTSTGTGFRSASWATYARVAGEYLEPAGGHESWQQGAVVAQQPPRFRIRYRTDVVPKHRLVWNGQTLEIAAVITETAVGNRFTILLCGLAQ
jgi:head-tail adaptor